MERPSTALGSPQKPAATSQQETPAAQAAVAFQVVGEIKAEAGLTLAQEPASAKFDSMPRSAVDAGVLEIAAAVEDLPGRILTYPARPAIAAITATLAAEKKHGNLDQIITLLRTRTGHDFSSYKRSTLDRRIERRMSIHQIDKVAAYTSHLRDNPQELDLLFKELLIGVTRFFRDPLAWHVLREETLPALLAKHPAGPLRAWVAGCSTGEEAYSLAIVLKEVSESLKPHKNFKIQIFASDLDRDAIDKARQGVFVKSMAADLSPEQLRRFFTKQERGYRVRAEIREMVIFSPHSLILDPPFTKLDFLSCRNLLIYLTPEIQDKLLPLFHYSLNPGGLLLLGSAESIGHHTGLFATVSGKFRIFRRLESAVRPEPIEFPASFAPALPAAAAAQPEPKAHPSLQSLAEHFVLQRYAPSSVLANQAGDILYISGRTGKYLEPAAGKANWNVFAMAREGLRHPLPEAFQQALRQLGPVTLHGLHIQTNGGLQLADVSIEKLAASEPLGGLVMIVFMDLAAPLAPPRPGKTPAHSPQVADLEHLLHQARAELLNTRKAMQAAQEELKSTNEEMQSANEQMQTLNAELQGRVLELSRSNRAELQAARQPPPRLDISPESATI